MKHKESENQRKKKNDIAMLEEIRREKEDTEQNKQTNKENQCIL